MNTFGDISVYLFSHILKVLYMCFSSWLNMVLHCRSVDCFRLGWPMRADADFFCQPVGQLNTEKDGVHNNYASSLFLSTYFFRSGICYTDLISSLCDF